MFFKMIFSCGIFILLFLSLSCQDNGTGNPPVVEPPKAPDWNGIFNVKLSDYDSSVQLSGIIYEKPYPASAVWEEVAKSGDCRLIKPKRHFCSEPCPIGSICAGNDSCASEPLRLDIGNVDVKGLVSKEGTSAFSLQFVAYQYGTSEDLKYPPCNDGETVTFSVAGNSNIPAFTLAAKGFSPLKLHEENIMYEDGKPIDLTWDPPANPGNTVIDIEIDITYHGTTKAQIVAETADDGSLTVPAPLLDSLKTFGISGFPRLLMYRRAIVTNETKNVKLVIESEVTRYLNIPGVISCGGDEPCPEGTTCQADKRCK